MTFINYATAFNIAIPCNGQRNLLPDANIEFENYQIYGHLEMHKNFNVWNIYTTF